METIRPNFFSKHSERIKQFIEQLDVNDFKNGLYAFITSEPNAFYKELPTVASLFLPRGPIESFKSKLLFIGQSEMATLNNSVIIQKDYIVMEDFTEITEDGIKLNATFQLFEADQPSYFIDVPEYSPFRGISSNLHTPNSRLRIQDLRKLILANKYQKSVEYIFLENLDVISFSDIASNLSSHLDQFQKDKLCYEYLISKLHFFTCIFEVKILFPINQKALPLEEANFVKHLPHINETVDYLDNLILLKNDFTYEFIKINRRFEH